jgi:hypothetical protein
MVQVILIEHDVCLREFSLASMRCLPKVISACGFRVEGLQRNTPATFLIFF